jgi:hypothetical protein
VYSRLAGYEDVNDAEPFPLEGHYHDLQSRIAWAAFIQPCHFIPFHTPAIPDVFEGFAIVPTMMILRSMVGMCRSNNASVDWMRPATWRAL